jgi:hypothetical protein
MSGQSGTGQRGEVELARRHLSFGSGGEEKGRDIDSLRVALPSTTLDNVVEPTGSHASQATALVSAPVSSGVQQSKKTKAAGTAKTKVPVGWEQNAEDDVVRRNTLNFVTKRLATCLSNHKRLRAAGGPLSPEQCWALISDNVPLPYKLAMDQIKMCLDAGTKVPDALVIQAALGNRRSYVRQPIDRASVGLGDYIPSLLGQPPIYPLPNVKNPVRRSGTTPPVDDPEPDADPPLVIDKVGTCDASTQTDGPHQYFGPSLSKTQIALYSALSGPCYDPDVAWMANDPSFVFRYAQTLALHWALDNLPSVPHVADRLDCTHSTSLTTTVVPNGMTGLYRSYHNTIFHQLVGNFVLWPVSNGSTVADCPIQDGVVNVSGYGYALPPVFPSSFKVIYANAYFQIREVTVQTDGMAESNKLVIAAYLSGRPRSSYNFQAYQLFITDARRTGKLVGTFQEIEALKNEMWKHSNADLSLMELIRVNSSTIKDFANAIVNPGGYNRTKLDIFILLFFLVFAIVTFQKFFGIEYLALVLWNMPEFYAYLLSGAVLVLLCFFRPQIEALRPAWHAKRLSMYEGNTAPIVEEILKRTPLGLAIVLFADKPTPLGYLQHLLLRILPFPVAVPAHYLLNVFNCPPPGYPDSEVHQEQLLSTGAPTPTVPVTLYSVGKPLGFAPRVLDPSYESIMAMVRTRVIPFSTHSSVEMELFLAFVKEQFAPLFRSEVHPMSVPEFLRSYDDPKKRAKYSRAAETNDWGVAPVRAKGFAKQEILPTMGPKNIRPIVCPQDAHGCRTGILAKAVGRHLTLFINQHPSGAFFYAPGKDALEAGEFYSRTIHHPYRYKIDQSKYDAHQRSFCWVALSYIMQEMGVSPDDFEQSMLEAWAVVKFPHGIKVQYAGQRMTGSHWTTVGNTLLAMALVCYCLHKQGKFTLSMFHLMANGDDSDLSLDEKLDESEFTKVMELLGFEVDLLETSTSVFCSKTPVRVLDAGVERYCYVPLTGRTLFQNQHYIQPLNNLDTVSQKAVGVIACQGFNPVLSAQALTTLRDPKAKLVVERFGMHLPTHLQSSIHTAADLAGFYGFSPSDFAIAAESVSDAKPVHPIVTSMIEQDVPTSQLKDAKYWPNRGGDFDSIDVVVRVPGEYIVVPVGTSTMMSDIQSRLPSGGWLSYNGFPVRTVEDFCKAGRSGLLKFNVLLPGGGRRTRSPNKKLRQRSSSVAPQSTEPKPKQQAPPQAPPVKTPKNLRVQQAVPVQTLKQTALQVRLPLRPFVSFFSSIRPPLRGRLLGSLRRFNARLPPSNHLHHLSQLASRIVVPPPSRMLNSPPEEIHHAAPQVDDSAPVYEKNPVPSSALNRPHLEAPIMGTAECSSRYAFTVLQPYKAALIGITSGCPDLTMRPTYKFSTYQNIQANTAVNGSTNDLYLQCRPNANLQTATATAYAAGVPSAFTQTSNPAYSSMSTWVDKMRVVAIEVQLRNLSIVSNQSGVCLQGNCDATAAGVSTWTTLAQARRFMTRTLANPGDVGRVAWTPLSGQGIKNTVFDNSDQQWKNYNGTVQVDDTCIIFWTQSPVAQQFLLTIVTHFEVLVYPSLESVYNPTWALVNPALAAELLMTEWSKYPITSIEANVFRDDGSDSLIEEGADLLVKHGTKALSSVLGNVVSGLFGKAAQVKEAFNRAPRSGLFPPSSSSNDRIERVLALLTDSDLGNLLLLLCKTANVDPSSFKIMGVGDTRTYLQALVSLEALAPPPTAPVVAPRLPTLLDPIELSRVAPADPSEDFRKVYFETEFVEVRECLPDGTLGPLQTLEKRVVVDLEDEFIRPNPDLPVNPDELKTMDVLSVSNDDYCTVSSHTPSSIGGSQASTPKTTASLSGRQALKHVSSSAFGRS